MKIPRWQPCCGYCKKNGARPQEYLSHLLKGPRETMCSILRAKPCQFTMREVMRRTQSNLYAKEHFPIHFLYQMKKWEIESISTPFATKLLISQSKIEFKQYWTVLQNIQSASTCILQKRSIYLLF